MAYNAKTGQYVPDEKPGDFPTYAPASGGGYTNQVVPSAKDQEMQRLTEGGWVGSINAQGQPVGDLATYQAKQKQAVVDSSAAKTDLSKIQTDFQSLLNSLTNKQTYNMAGLNPSVSLVDLMKSKGIADTSAQARQQLAQSAGIVDYNPNNAESNKKLAEAILNSTAVSSTLNKYEPGSNEYNQALSTVAGSVAANTPQPAPAPQPVTKGIPNPDNDPYIAEYNRITEQVDKNSSDITASLNQLKTGAIPLTADQQAVVDSTQRSFDNAIAKQKEANQSQENIVRRASFRDGSEYTPEVSSSIIKNVIDANTLKIQEYDQQAIAAIAKLKQDFKDANYKNIKEGYETLNKALKDKQDNLLSLMKLSHDYEKESLNYRLNVLKYQEDVRHNMATETNTANKVAGVTVSSPNADVINTILGSGKFTEAQTKQIINSINNNENPTTVIKNQAKNLLTGANKTDLEKLEVAQSAMKSLKDSLNAYYAAGGSTNIVKGTFENMFNKLGEVNDPKLVTIASQIRRNLQTYRNAISGTAYSNQEGKQIESVFPGITKSKQLNDAIFAGVLDDMSATVDGYYSSVLGTDIYNNIKNGSLNKSNAGDLKIDENTLPLLVQKYMSDGLTEQQANQKAYEFLKEYNKRKTPSVSNLKDAIVSQESQGNYKSVNKDSGALGKYQIMPFNLPGLIGLANTPENRQKFLNSPQLQDKAFNALLTELNTTYNGDVRKVLAAYYGGDDAAKIVGTKAADKPQGKYPSINQYVNQILNKLA